MPDKFDAYREALVMETNTIWPDEQDGLTSEERARIEQALHNAPEKCTDLQYVRMHTGFCRQITVTPEDLQRARGE